MNEHPQQSDRILRDTRILTLRIWAVVGCIVIAAVILTLWASWRRLSSFSLSVLSLLL